MKTSLLLVLVTGLSLVLTAGSCLQGKHIVGSKNYISKEVKADHFNEIKLVGSANISYWQDTCSHVEIHGSDNIIPLIETYVEGSTFIIKFKKNVTIWKGKLEIKVFAPELNKLSVNGSGNIRLINGITAKRTLLILHHLIVTTNQFLFTCPSLTYGSYRFIGKTESQT